MKAYHHLIKGPIITEKSHALKEAANKVTFRVAVKANKIEIRKAIEELFKVKVLGVNTIQMRGKKKRVGRRDAARLEKHVTPPRERSRLSTVKKWSVVQPMECEKKTVLLKLAT
jgi:large subunit ribosomal protein L23